MDELRDAVAAARGPAAVADAARLDRFLRAAKGSVARAARSLLAHLDWREQHLPIGAHAGGTSLVKVRGLVADGKCRLVRRAPPLCPVLAVHFAEVLRDRVTPPELLAAWIHIIEEAAADARATPAPEGSQPEEGFVVVFDCVGSHRLPTSFLQRLSAVMGVHYPCMIRRTLVYGAPAQHTVQDALMHVDLSGVFAPTRFVPPLPGALAVELQLAEDELPSILRSPRIGPQPPGETERSRDGPPALVTDSVDVAHYADPSPAAGVGSDEARLAADAAAVAPHPVPMHTPPRRGGGTVTVHVPWYPDGVEREEVTLEDEIVDFSRLLLLRSSEQTQRTRRIRTALQMAVQQVLPHETVKLFGSFACGLACASSSPDFVVESGADRAAAMAIETQLREQGISIGSRIDFPTGVLLRIMSGTELDATLVIGLADERRVPRVQLSQRWLDELTAARCVYVTIRHILEQSRCLGMANGGLPPYALLLMTFHVCRACAAEAAQTTRRTLSNEQVLYRFLLHFGQRFDAAQFCVDPRVADPTIRRDPVHAGEQLVVLDPLDPQRNVSTGLRKMPQIRTLLAHTLSSLARWDSNAGSKKGWKGRTPLACVISYKPLWARCSELLSLEALSATAALPAHASPHAPPGAAQPPPPPLPGAARREMSL